MKESIRQLQRIHDKGYFAPSADFGVERLPDGRQRLHLLKKLKGGCPPSITVTISGLLLDCGPLPAGGGDDGVEYTDVSINGTFTLPLDFAGNNVCFWSAFVDGTLHFDGSDFFGHTQDGDKTPSQ